MRWKLLGVLLLGLLILSSFGSAGIGNSDKDKACRLVRYWVFENGRWVEKSEPRVWWYCQEPEKVKGFRGFAFREMPYGLFKRPDVGVLHQAVRDLAGLMGIDELHGEFSANLPSYGGMFINEEKGLIFVYVKDEKDREKIKQALEKYRGKVNIVFLKSKYNFEELLKWKEKTRELFRIKELEVTMLDADEAHNTLTIGLADVTPEKLQLLENELEKIGIPKEAVKIEKRKPGMPTLSPTDKFDTLIGGIKITALRGSCTLGFTSKINGEDYFVTAAHCAEFGVTGEPVYQPWGIGSWRKVGTIIKNPPLSSNFPSRLTDSMLVKVSGRDIDHRVYSNWNVIGTAESYVGAYVCKMGITTYTTCGYITETHSSIGIDRDKDGYTDYWLFDVGITCCMDSDEGDSGAPVFYKSYYTNDISIVGILNGKYYDGIYYSEIDGIFSELGNMEVSWS
ncbi:Osmosensitive K+ channel histidine kinase KdpD [Thermococcus sp. 2319x1]|uniref:S1 family peptidase n=1 Tax=Thermococcus sp. 2319x1 TaxID=1674923 RepID=UPI00073ACC49|nr:S1 family peptidase [Thermococcus sp. 2319x1]ALV62165.1 Osmosensitive K+ channel histidine kinase KdpD [Thermococcus sp. 2319x1]